MSPNEEQIKKHPKIQITFKKMRMIKKIAYKVNNLGVKKCRIRLMRSAIIKKASQDEQQNQTISNQIKTNINYIKNWSI